MTPSTIIQKFLKVICPLMLIVAAVLVVIGIVAPWPVAEKMLGPDWVSKSVLLGVHSQRQHHGHESTQIESKTYLALPGTSRAFTVVTVTRENGAVRVEDDPGALISVIGLYGLLIAGTWWFWIRARKSE